MPGKDVLGTLPTWPYNRLYELLPLRKSENPN